MFTIHTPNIVLFNNSFETFEQAEINAQQLLDKSHVKFISIRQDNKPVQVLFKKGYKKYAWWQLKKHLNDNVVKDFIVVELNGVKNYYAILK
jgi:alpha-D-ribose 1-methylphosphonate 5-triphosphate diphosphatase PhnM